MIVIELPFRLPGLNEYTRACRSHPVVGAEMKRVAMQQIMSHLPPLRINAIKKIEIIYVEPNSRRDIDNVFSFGSKCILDALVKHGMLPDDSQKFVTSLTQSVAVEKGVKKIIVLIASEEA